MLRVLSIANFVLGLLVLCGISLALPARWGWVDAIGGALGLSFLLCGYAFWSGVQWARCFSLAVTTIALIIGAGLVTTLALTASYLSGLYGPVGGGGALLLVAVAALVVPYLVVFPAAQLTILLRLKETNAQTK